MLKDSFIIDDYDLWYKKFINCVRQKPRNYNVEAKL